jgi:hypothetical protein
VNVLAGTDNLSSHHLSQNHFLDTVPLSEGKKKAQRRCNVHCNKEKYLKGKDGG